MSSLTPDQFAHLAIAEHFVTHFVKIANNNKERVSIIIRISK